METQQAEETVYQIPVSDILADENENVRFGLKPSRVDDLADQIQAHGSIHTPLWVSPLGEPLNGHSYKLTAGAYRLAAAGKLGMETVPCLIREVGDDLARMKQQLSENMDRESMTPMDQARAIKKLLDAGVPRLEIRTIFARPGGRKGNKKQPASNSYINMMVTFLQFPKAIQTKIHNGPDQGGIGVATAYELTKVSRDKWETVLADAEAERTKAIEREEADEKKFLANEAKKEEAVTKANQLAEELEAKRKALQAASAEYDQLNEKQMELFKQAKAKALNEEDNAKKKAAEEELKKIEAEAKEKEKAASDLKKEVDKLAGKTETANTRAQELAEKLKEARLKAAKKKPAPGPGDIKKAAAAAGASKDGRVPLNATDMRRLIDDMCLPGFAKVQIVGGIIKRAFSSEITDKQCIAELAYALKDTAKMPPHMKASAKTPATE